MNSIEQHSLVFISGGGIFTRQACLDLRKAAFEALSKGNLTLFLATAQVAYDNGCYQYY